MSCETYLAIDGIDRFHCKNITVRRSRATCEPGAVEVVGNTLARLKDAPPSCTLAVGFNLSRPTLSPAGSASLAKFPARRGADACKGLISTEHKGLARAEGAGLRPSVPYQTLGFAGDRNGACTS